MNSTRSFFVFPELYWSLNALILKIVYNQVINEISENASSRKLENQNWFSQPPGVNILPKEYVFCEGIVFEFWQYGAEFQVSPEKLEEYCPEKFQKYQNWIPYSSERLVQNQQMQINATPSAEMVEKC